MPAMLKSRPGFWILSCTDPKGVLQEAPDLCHGAKYTATHPIEFSYKRKLLLRLLFAKNQTTIYIIRFSTYAIQPEFAHGGLVPELLIGHRERLPCLFIGILAQGVDGGTQSLFELAAYECFVGISEKWNKGKNAKKQCENIFSVYSLHLGVSNHTVKAVKC